MARKFTESFDLETLDQFSSATAATVVSSSIGGGNFAMSSGGEQFKQFSSGDSEMYFAFYLQPDNPGDNAGHKSIAWMNGSTVLGSLRFNGSRQLYLYVGSSPVATGTYVWSDSESRHIQVYVKLDDSTGIIQVKIDDILEIDYAGDTKPGSETEIDAFKHEADGRFAAIIVNDTSGPEDNSWPGVVRMRGRKPDADGNFNDFDRDPASPTTAYTHLDETGAPDPADIVSSDVNGDRQSLRFPSHGLIRAQVLSNNFFYHMRKISSGEGTHGLARLSDNVEEMDAAPRALSTSFRTEIFRYTTNPVTELPWTLDEAQEDEYESIMEAVT